MAHECCTPEKHYPGVLGNLLPSGVASILGAVSTLWRVDEFLDSTGWWTELHSGSNRLQMWTRGRSEMSAGLSAFHAAGHRGNPHPEAGEAPSVPNGRDALPARRRALDVRALVAGWESQRRTVLGHWNT